MKTNAITYLLTKKLKNSIKELFKKPARLIYAIVMIALIVVTAISGKKNVDENTVFRDLRELTAGITALYILIFGLIAYNGFKNGATMFKMPDVNLLFTSPMHPRKVLFYGLFQQLGTSLLLGVFILYQYSWLHILYGINFLHLIIILLGYSLSVFVAQLTAMVIYSFTSYDDKKKRIAAVIFFGIIIAYAIGLVMFLLKDMDNVLTNLVTAGNSIFLRLMPGGGWIGGILNGILLKDVSVMLLGIALTAAYIAGMTILLSYAKQDYYEDVLKTSEEQFSLASAQKEGKIMETVGKIRVGKTGLSKGEGASAFYYKHKLEERRARRFILEPAGIVFMIVSIVFAVFMRKYGIASIFAYTTYMQMISVKMGRFSKELGKPYIYLVPESSFKKILYSIAQSFTGFLVEAAILYIALAFILKLTPYDVVILILARMTFSCLFTACNILIQRVFGTLSSRTLIYIFYFIASFIMAAPGAIVAVLISNTGFVLLSQYVLPFLAMSVCNAAISLLVIYLCRDVLKYAELK